MTNAQYGTYPPPPQKAQTKPNQTKFIQMSEFRTGDEIVVIEH